MHHDHQHREPRARRFPAQVPTSPEQDHQDAVNQPEGPAKGVPGQAQRPCRQKPVDPPVAGIRVDALPGEGSASPSVVVRLTNEAPEAAARTVVETDAGIEVKVPSFPAKTVVQLVVLPPGHVLAEPTDGHEGRASIHRGLKRGDRPGFRPTAVIGAAGAQAVAKDLPDRSLKRGDPLVQSDPRPGGGELGSVTQVPDQSFQVAGAPAGMAVQPGDERSFRPTKTSVQTGGLAAVGVLENRQWKTVLPPPQYRRRTVLRPPLRHQDPDGGERLFTDGTEGSVQGVDFVVAGENDDRFRGLGSRGVNGSITLN